MVRKIEVIAPQKQWVEQFEQEQSILERIFDKQILAIHHIGSTAIRNINAKPVIDILMVVKDIQVIDRYNQEMIRIGYECLGENGMLGRRFFIKGGDNRSHHLHVFQDGNSEIQRHILFRDFMNNHPAEAADYSRLKKELAQTFPYDIESYVAGKTAFIKKADEKARSWYDQIGSRKNTMSYRRATEHDYSKLVGIWQRAVKETHDFLQEKDFQTIKMTLPTYFPHLDMNIWLVKEKMIGFSGMDGDKLEMLFLDPIYIGKGYGRQIVAMLLEQNQLRLVDVNEQNLAARVFYQKLGFEEYARSEVDDVGRPYPILHLRQSRG